MAAAIPGFFLPRTLFDLFCVARALYWSTEGRRMGLVIYLDSFLLLNLILDYLLLLLTGRIAGAALFRGRLLLSALLGSAYAGAALLPALGFLHHPLIRVGIGVLMVLIGYGSQRQLGKLILLFFALSAALGGGLYAMRLMGLGLPALEVKHILLFSAAAYCVMSLAGRKLARHGPREYRKVVVRLGDAAAELTALVDSGNTLTDPVNGKAVVVTEGRCLASLLPPEIDLLHPAQCLPALRDPRRFRLLPYRSVGVEQGLLLAVRADQVQIDGRDAGARLVALSPTPVSDTGRYNALIFEE